MDNNENELFEKLSRLQWLIGRRRAHGFMENGPFSDPTRGQGRVLAMLKMQPEISTKDLSYLLGIRQQSLNELLNKLEKAGCIERVASEEDKRVMMVRLTDKGREEGPQKRPDFSDIFKCLTPEEQETFADFLDRIIEDLEGSLSDEEKDDMSRWFHSARSRLGDEMIAHFQRFRGGQGGPGGSGGPDGRFRGGRRPPYDPDDKDFSDI